ncbi:uncharacterized protein F4807DRAFT_458541 [Annulohypoxylon truncatum]|uniref:uncharacterized protein n=1 Tax=Annulohypoxylon truncatum TaxID=327061 RepID=UPI0020089537|nr:uncharacterized protein F4807DRAFT_458541 [Annulohypoxylon truncatum]KAI1211645.1 hypothetical protein F4807DRAFT_458541 [Annulohypoxylon truncatum]
MRHDESHFDINASNGTCYYGVNIQAKDDYIPCGNVELGANWSCCVAGDICLGSSACYHRHFDITYLAGCTDPSYKDSSCPFKGRFGSQQWVGLENCKYNNDIWAGCKELDDVPGSRPPSACTCSKEVEVLTDKPVLDNIGQLPTSSGGTISWYEGREPVFTMMPPTVAKSATATVTSSSDQPSNTVNPLSDPNATHPSTIVWNPSESTSSPVQVSTTPSTVVPPSSQPDLSASTPTGTNLSTAAQAGIGIGAGFGAILLGSLLYLVFFLRKRQGILRGHAMAQSDLPGGPIDPTSPTATELAADELKRASELPGSPAASELASPMSSTGPRRSFRAYNPHLHGNYAQKSPGSRTRIDEDQTLSTEGGDPLASPISPLSPTSPSSVKAEKGSAGTLEHEKEDTKKGPTATEPVFELEG